MSDRLRHACIEVFGLEPHQARYLLTTFTPATISREFLAWPGQISKWRRLLGLPPVGIGRGRRVNGAAPTSRYFG